jgi:transposase-like protein
MIRKQYTREFKIEAVQLSEESDRPIYQVAKDLGIHQNTLYKWRGQQVNCDAKNLPGFATGKGARTEKPRLPDQGFERVARAGSNGRPQEVNCAVHIFENYTD